MKKSNKKNLALTIPHEIMELVDIGKCKELNIDLNDDIIIITKKSKSAKVIAKTVELLHEVSNRLEMQLAEACGECQKCGNSQHCIECGECELYYCDQLDEDDFDDIPEELFYFILDNNYCIGSLSNFLGSNEIIMEVDDEE